MTEEDVVFNCKFNLIDKNGNLLFDKSIGWMDTIKNYSCGYAQIYSDNTGTNYIDKEGRILSVKWFVAGHNFYYGFANVMDKIDGKYMNNYLKTDGTLLSKEWFRSAYHFDDDGTSKVQTMDGEWYKIDGEGNLKKER